MLHILEDIWDGIYERIVAPLIKRFIALGIGIALLGAVLHYFS